MLFLGIDQMLTPVDSARRRSCEMVNTPRPCVNKTVHHIGKLEERVKEWLVLQNEIEQKTSVIRLPCSDSEDATAESPVLNIRGLGLFDKDSPEPSNGVPLNLNTEAIVSEVIELIWRLEKDRQEAEEALKLEKKRRQGLSSQIDLLSKWKLTNLPEAVQKEYDRAARDLSELRWHISRKKQELERARDRTAKTEAVNRKLQEEICFIEKHRPLLDEKLNHEGEAISRIKEAQAEASSLLSEAESLLKSSMLCFEEATEEANRERRDMTAQLAERRRNLQVCRDHLHQSEKIWAKCSLDLMDIERKMEDGRKLYSELIHQKQQLTQNEISWNQQVTDLKYELDDQEKKTKHLTKMYDRVSKEAKEMESDFQSQLSELEEKRCNELRALRDQEYNNKTFTLENEDLSRNIGNSYRTREKHESDIKRMQKNLLKNEEQTTQVSKDVSKVSVSHAASKTKLENLEDKSVKEERRLKNLADSLRKQIIEEVKAGQITQAQINALMAEKQQKEKENNRLKAELTKIVEEIEGPVAELEEEFRKITQLHVKKSEELSTVQQKKQQCDETFKMTNQQLEREKSSLEHKLSSIQMTIAEVSKELQNTMDSMLQFQKSTQDVIQYGNIVKSTMMSTQNTITVLQQKYNLEELRLNDVKDTFSQLVKEEETYTCRMKSEDEDYNLQLQSRQKMQKHSAAALEMALCENSSLAKEYKLLQTRFLDEKDKLMVSYEIRIKMESTIRDHLQISVLQSRMHRALVEFFKQRGLYNQAGLARFQAASQENAHKILAVQEEMSKTIQHISTFLTSLTDGSPREDSKENKHSTLRAETKDRESHTVHITV
ncbi:coiled-coil domain-containing protein 178 [Gastrophryne carolinensis]